MVILSILGHVANIPTVISMTYPQPAKQGVSSGTSQIPVLLFLLGPGRFLRGNRGRKGLWVENLPPFIESKHHRMTYQKKLVRCPWNSLEFGNLLFCTIMLALFVHGVPSVFYTLLYGGTVHFQLGQDTRRK